MLRGRMENNTFAALVQKRSKEEARETKNNTIEIGCFFFFPSSLPLQCFFFRSSDRQIVPRFVLHQSPPLSLSRCRDAFVPPPSMRQQQHTEALASIEETEKSQTYLRFERRRQREAREREKKSLSSKKKRNRKNNEGEIFFFFL